MTPQQFVGLGIRLAAIWLVFSSYQYAVLVPKALNGAFLGEESVYSYATSVMYLAAALLLWFFPMWTAHKLLPRTRDVNTINLNPYEAARVGCALIGLWFFGHGFLNGIWYVFRAFVFTGSLSSYASLSPNDKLDFLVAAANLAMGAFLVLRSGMFAKWVVGNGIEQRK
ncbi:MAG TPA: hypothetical protein VIU93_04380 [Gallionellaceae bacterium]